MSIINKSRHLDLMLYTLSIKQLHKKYNIHLIDKSKHYKNAVIVKSPRL